MVASATTSDHTPLFWDRHRHDWPDDVLGHIGALPIASATALGSYRVAHHQIHAPRPASVRDPTDRFFCDPDEMDRDPPRGDTGTGGSRRLVLVLIPLMLVPGGSLVAGAYQLFPFVCLPLLILGPALLQRDRSEPPGPADDAEGPDNNGGSPTPDIPPNLPGGGLLLPDAGLSARRYRGEPASPLIPSRTRRSAHPPERRPVPLRH